MANYNKSKEEIKCIVNEGHSILEIEIDGESAYFFTNDFEPPAIGSVTSNPYLTFSGIDISQFLTTADYSLNVKQIFLERFATTIRDAQIMSYKFSDNHIWRFYS